jgi:hypothetical protein
LLTLLILALARMLWGMRRVRALRRATLVILSGLLLHGCSVSAKQPLTPYVGLVPAGA